MQRVRGETIQSQGGEEAPQTRQRPEMMLRIYSALILIAVALALTYASLETFAVLITLFIGVMAWEWGRLVRKGGFDLAFAVQFTATAIASVATMRSAPDWALLSVALGALAAFAVGTSAKGNRHGWWSAAGVLYAGLPAIALIWIRSDNQYGLWAILYIFAIVWTTDSAAYVAGRSLGGPKLAPRISPKKTWSGLIGGMTAAIIASGIFALAIDSAAALTLMVMAGLLALVAQLGDLGESALKRYFDIKDSSGLIPGHGGVLDRIDGLIFVAVAAALIAWIADPANPGRALLVWQ